MATGVSSDKPQQFKSGDHVILQSVNDTAIYGTVRWTGDVGIHGQSVPFVGIETVSQYILFKMHRFMYLGRYLSIKHIIFIG